MTRAKICGLTREADVRAAVDAGAAAVGFVCSVPVDTPRELAPGRAAELAAEVPPFVASVLVTMPETADRAVSLVETVRPDVLQLHGDLPPPSVADVAERVDAAVVKAVDTAEENSSAYADAADALLVDSAGEGGAGGTGRTHDWRRTRDLVERLDVPVVLAGGLTPENVAEAVETVRPFAVDVASGVETEPGRKDNDAVAAFVRNAGRVPE